MGEERLLIVFRFGSYVLEMDTISLEFYILAYGDSNKTIYNLINLIKLHGNQDMLQLLLSFLLIYSSKKTQITTEI